MTSTSNLLLVCIVAIIAILAALPFRSSLITKAPQKVSQRSKALFHNKMPGEQPIVLPTSGAPGLLADKQSSLAVILTHPWGPLGGNMHNNVVRAGAKFFQNLGITTLRFDFVGWQLSWGTYQAQQVVEAAQFLLNNNDNDDNQSIKPTKILLVGYSYGSLLAASASASIDQVVGVVSVAPPWSVRYWLLLFNSNQHLNQAKQKEDLPRLCIIGDHDNFTSETAFWKTLEGFPTESTTGTVLKNRDHFFFGKEGEVMNVIQEWLLNTFPKCEGDLKKLSSSDVFS